MRMNKTLIGLNFAVFIMMLGVGMTMALLPKRVIDLTASSSAVGYLASAFALSYIILQVPIGNLSDKLGFKLFLVIGYLLCALTGVIYYFSTTANTIFIGRILQGAGEAPVWALAPALLSIKFPDSKGTVMGIYNAAIHLGLTAGPVLGIILAKVWTANQAFLFYAIMCLLGAVTIYLTVDNFSENETKVKETMSFEKLWSLVTDKKILIAFIGITFYGAGYGIFLTIIPAFLISIKNYSQNFIGVFFALFYLAVSLSQLITGPLSDKFGRKLFMTAGLILAAIGIGVFPGMSQPWISIVLTIASLGLGIFCISSMAFLNETVPDSFKGTISGAYYLFWGIGFFFGPLLIGKLGELPGHYFGFYLFALLLFAEVVIMMFSGSFPEKEDCRHSA